MRHPVLLLLSGLAFAVAPLESAMAQTEPVQRPRPGDPYAPYVAEASQRFGVPVAWIRAVLRAESAGDLRAERRPAGEPAADEAVRVRRVEQVHAERAGRHLLFPHGNLAAGHGGREQHQQRRRLMRELVERGKVHARGAGIFRDPGGLEQAGKGVALVVGDRDDAPGGELAMIRRPQRERDDLAERGGVGAGRDHVARLARAAGGEMGEERGAVVEHARHVAVRAAPRKCCE